MLSSDFKPYLLRSFYTYLSDKGLTPYIHVFVNETTNVPQEFVIDNAITFNIGMLACSNIKIENHHIEFQARFSGQIREVDVPMGHILTIYAHENTDLILTFPLEEKEEVLSVVSRNQRPHHEITQMKALANHLKIVKKK